MRRYGGGSPTARWTSGDRSRALDARAEDGSRAVTRFVETTSTTPARIFGLYPKKGVIRAGSDADVVLWDPVRRGVVSAEADLSNSDYSVYEGWPVTGWPVMTIRRGEVIAENGRVTGRAGSGRLVSRERWRK